MKNNFHFVLLMICTLASTNKVFGQFDTTFWYSYGLPDYWINQPDVIAFKTIGGLAYTGAIDTNAVDTIIYQANRRDKANEVHFKSTATLLDVQSFLQLVYASGQLETFYITITRNPYLPSYLNGWYVVDDLVLVNFVDPYVTQNAVDSFMLRWDLSYYYQPDLGSLPVGGNYTYIFKINLAQRSNYDFIKTVRDIYLQEAGFVAEASPNVVNLPFGAMNNGGSGTGTVTVVPPVPCNNGFPDEYYYEEWYIGNQGNWYFSAPGMANDVSSYDADADICECWAAGLSGQGIKVNILGDGGYDFNSPDLVNQFNGQWDCTVNPCVPVITASIIGGGYETCLVLAAEANTPNNQYNLQNIVGVAYNCQVTPIRVSSIGSYGQQTSFDIMVRALDQALINEADVVGTTFFSNINNGNLGSTITNHTTNGRSGKGTILIAHTGFMSGSPLGAPTYPASYTDKVLSVTTSDPNDHIHDQNVNTAWSAVGASNYGSQYDIAVPGTPIYVGTGSVQGAFNNYTFLSGTGSVAISAGIAAMLLQSNANLTYTQMLNLFRQGAEKVGGYTYNIPGTTVGAGNKSNEFGYGRVSCKNMISPTVALENASNNTQVIVENPFDNNLTFKWFDAKYNEIEISLWDIKGSKVLQKTVVVSTNNYQIDTKHLAAGIYTLQISAKGNIIAPPTKVVKLP